jgi:hypothetical protein
MSIENREFSKQVKAGKRTYFFDIEKNGGKFISITESKSTQSGFERNEIKVYIDDVNNFVQGLNEAIEHYNSTIKPVEKVTASIGE